MLYIKLLPGTRPETLKILCAPTGNAEFNKGEVKSNSAFDIFNHNHEYRSLSNDGPNTLICNFIDLK